MRAFTSGLLGAALGALVIGAPGPSLAQSDVTGPPGYTLSRTGGPHDFDVLVGAWTTHQRRLKARGVGSDDWAEFPATICVQPFLDGAVEADEMYTPSTGRRGFSVRAFNPAKRRWTDRFISSATGEMEPGVFGGFDGPHGEFYGEDVDNGRPIKVRNVWTILDRDHVRWEQAFSYDDRTWEMNWTADLTRADPAAICDGGRPKR